MKRLIYLLCILLVLYFGIEISFINLNKGHNVEYKIKHEKTEFLVKEIYVQKTKNEIRNYYFEIKVGNNTFNFQTYDNLKKANYVIKDINYFSDEKYSCIYPTLKKENSITDVICIKDNVQYYYNQLKGEDEKLDSFVKTLKNYSKLDINNNRTDKIDADPVILYTDNIIDNHFVVLQNYKGVYLINKKDNVKNIDLFKQDVYKNNINIINNEYYITADYNKEYKFHEFYLVNIKNGKKKTIASNDEISLDSYMQGSIDNEVYLFDRASKEQYRMNIKNKTVVESGNTSKGISLYSNNEFTTGSAYDAAKENLTFTKYSIDNKFEDKTYSKVDRVGNKLSGYYYLYEKDNNDYKVYRVNVQNKNIKTYLFKIDDLNKVSYYRDYIYYKRGLYIKYYQDKLGEKDLLKDSEFEFNDSLNFGLYVN